MTIRGFIAGVAAIVPLLAVSACGGGSEGSAGADTITIYTCVSDTTIQPAIDQFEKNYPGTKVDLYRAPTGDLNARVASDVRSGGLKADVIWACDPLTMQGYVKQGLVGGWVPDTNVPQNMRTEDYVGVAILYMLAVTHKGLAPPQSWSELTGSEYADGVAVPDPSLAASALGALGYFAEDPGYGMDYYKALEKNGAKQVSTPDDVVTGVAEGAYKAGITIANSAYLAKDGGSPIEISWPKPGAVEIYGPIALAKGSKVTPSAQDFINFVTGEDGQKVIAESGAYPTLPGVPGGPPIPEDSPVVTPDWATIGARTDDLLNDYQNIFGG